MPRSHAADAVFDRLAGLIFSGEIAPGAPLPSERDLAARFEVSRIIVRNATHRLAEIGLVRVRQGGATTACDPAEAANPAVAVLALRFGPSRRELLTDLFERQLLGGYPLLALAEQHIHADQVAELSALVDRHEQGDLALRPFEEAFWVKIADIGKNTFYRRDTRYWFSVLREEPRNHHPEFGTLEQRVGLYREILRRLARNHGAAEAYAAALSFALGALKHRHGTTP